MRPNLTDLTLDLTEKCFQQCLYCSSDSSAMKHESLSFETAQRVLDDFYFLGGRVVELSGGEPLSYEKIYEIIDYASNKGFEIHLFTCAFLPKKSIDFDRLDNVDRFYVNLQAPTEAVHDYLAQSRGSFKRVLNFVNDCKKRSKWIGTHLVPLSLNIDEIDEYVKMAELLKLDNVSLLRFVKQGRGKERSLSLNNDEIQHLFLLIEKYKNHPILEFKAGCPLDFGFIYSKAQSACPCASGISRCVVRPNGNVIPCPAFKDCLDFTAGNVNRDSLMDIWIKSAAFKRLRSFDYRKLGGICRTCSFLEVCRGRCHAQRYHFNGSLYKGPDPYCPLKLSTMGMLK